MNNLFIVNTPFHLLTSFILSKGFFPEDNNYLALMHPHGYEKWASNPLMNYISSTQCGYKEIFPLIHFLSSRNKTVPFKTQVQQVQNSIGKLHIDNVFLGSDIDPQNQLLVASLDINNFNRFEDGLYSYYNENRRRSKLDELFHKLKIWSIKKSAGIKNTKLYINTSTASDSKSGIADYMYKPELLQRFSPNPIVITKDKINIAINDLKSKKFLQQKINNPAILYLSQPLVEQKLFSIEEELHCLQSLIKPLNNKGELLYKPHPNDSKDKINYFQEKIPQLKIFNSIEPAELLYTIEDNLIAVVSYQSTALMYTDKFSNHVIKAISLSDFAQSPMYYKYKEIMQNAGVYFPNRLDDIIKIFQKG